MSRRSAAIADAEPDAWKRPMIATYSPAETRFLDRAFRYGRAKGAYDAYTGPTTSEEHHLLLEAFREAERAVLDDFWGFPVGSAEPSLHLLRTTGSDPHSDSEGGEFQKPGVKAPKTSTSVELHHNQGAKPDSALDTLLPCPFCGHDTLTVGGGDLHYVECKSCEADGPIAFSEGLAREAWNVRASRDVWVCSNPKQYHVWDIDPCGPCPTCSAGPYGVRWSTIRRSVAAVRRAPAEPPMGVAPDSAEPSSVCADDQLSAPHRERR